MPRLTCEPTAAFHPAPALAPVDRTVQAAVADVAEPVGDAVAGRAQPEEPIAPS
jgi:hypothetical protein